MEDKVRDPHMNIFIYVSKTNTGSHLFLISKTPKGLFIDFTTHIDAHSALFKFKDKKCFVFPLSQGHDLHIPFHICTLIKT